MMRSSSCGHLLVDLRDARHLRRLHLLHRLEVGVAEEEALPREQLPQDDADREDVGPRVDVLPHRRLGREVGELALDDARLALFELAVRLGEAEVHDLHLAVLRDEHVRRRHVAVDDVERDPVRVRQLVGVREALADLERDVDRGLDRKVAARLLDVLDDRLEVRPVDELHDDEVRVVADADVEDLDAVRVRELRREARLVEEHRDELLLRRQVRQDALDGDLLLKPWRPSLSARKTSAMPPDSSFSMTRYRCWLSDMAGSGPGSRASPVRVPSARSQGQGRSAEHRFAGPQADARGARAACHLQAHCVVDTAPGRNHSRAARREACAHAGGWHRGQRVREREEARRGHDPQARPRPGHDARAVGRRRAGGVDAQARERVGPRGRHEHEDEGEPYLRVASPVVTLPADAAKQAPLFRKLLELNAAGLANAAFGLIGDRVVAVSERPVAGSGRGRGRADRPTPRRRRRHVRRSAREGLRRHPSMTAHDGRERTATEPRPGVAAGGWPPRSRRRRPRARRGGHERHARRSSTTSARRDPAWERDGPQSPPAHDDARRRRLQSHRHAPGRPQGAGPLLPRAHPLRRRLRRRERRDGPDESGEFPGLRARPQPAARRPDVRVRRGAPVRRRLARASSWGAST